MTQPRSTPVRLATALAVSTLALAACGGSDDDATADDESNSDAGADIGDAAASDDGSGDGSDALADNEPRDDLLDEVDPDGEFEDAVGELSPDTRYGIVAGQLDPEPSIEIDGSDIRLVFDGGSVDNAFTDCIIATVTQLDSETVTVVYPDGEEVC